MATFWAICTITGFFVVIAAVALIGLALFLVVLFFSRPPERPERASGRVLIKGIPYKITVMERQPRSYKFSGGHRMRS